MNLWPFNKKSSKFFKKEEIDFLVWEVNKLAICSLMPIAEHFPEYDPIIDSDLVEVWDCLMTVAMTGVAANSRNILIDTDTRYELAMSLNKFWEIGGDLFNDYFSYVNRAIEKTDAPFSGASAMWVAINLGSHKRASTSLKRNTEEILFINHLSSFMNMSFGNSDLCFSTFLTGMIQKMEEDDEDKKIQKLALAIEIYANKMADFIAEFDKDKR